VKPKLVIILLLLVLLPLGLMAWLGLRLVDNERVEIEKSFRQLQLDKLKDIDKTIQKVISERERFLQGLAARLVFEPDNLRAARRKHAIIRQIFVIDSDGRLLHPAVDQPMSQNEKEFVERAGQVWKDQSLFYHSGPEGDQSEQTSKQGWYSWYWGSGINLIFWQRTQGNMVIGFELDRFRLVADIIGELPGSDYLKPAAKPDSVDTLALLDSKDKILYRWGDYQPKDSEQPVVAMTVAAPLKPWRLVYYSSASVSGGALGSGTLFYLISGLVVVALGLIGLAFYFYSESSRELQQAGQRVSFVNHVSHELKTPLTNIRMYAELLQGIIDEQDEKQNRYLDVVVTESQRLSRLIDNVLTFGRQQRKALKLHLVKDTVDGIIGRLVDYFGPALEAKNIQVSCVAEAPRTVLIDPDALEQILSNLLSNVEKYAARGGRVEIRATQTEWLTTIMVSDNGPGIPSDEQEHIFEPFVRLSSEISEGAAGTGIGLSISRELARLHGGDLVYEPLDQGASFVLTLATHSASPDGVST
jgi:signal transduction histidine kinase